MTLQPLTVDQLVEQLRHQSRGFTFRCPTCGNRVRNNQAYEPMCTGPRWTDDHAPTVMVRVS